MPLLGYDTWRRFEDAIERAKIATEASDIDAGQHIFAGIGNIVVGFGVREVTDYRLTRYGAYHVALSGDPRKPEVAAAIRYFVVKTREAEIVPQQIPQTYADALRTAAEAI